VNGQTPLSFFLSFSLIFRALEIESVLLEHPKIKEVAVLGVPDEKWGEVVGAIIAPKADVELTMEEVKRFAESKLAKYKIPREVKFVEKIPRNVMGKVAKKGLRKMFAEENY